MTLQEESDYSIRRRLCNVYEEVMWLAQRPNGYTPSDARAWYTHIAYLGFRRHIRRFSGKVSHRAVIDGDASLRLEHFKRMQTTLTQLVKRHLESGARDEDEFVDTVIDCEQVHIVTARENVEAMKAKGDYASAEIELIDWFDVPTERKHYLWKKVLNGKVSNSAQFK